MVDLLIVEIYYLTRVRIGLFNLVFCNKTKLNNLCSQKSTKNLKKYLTFFLFRVYNLFIKIQGDLAMIQNKLYMNNIHRETSVYRRAGSVVSGANMPECSLVTGRGEFLLEIKYILALSQHFFFNLRE